MRDDGACAAAKSHVPCAQLHAARPANCTGMYRA
ncbi:hypothetical protein XGA_2703 [Xanthomonas hortorum ATCC 19865]|nr:hypothetical protein XGA_2703 [Xanthomonas hortorum ATCC 19865]